MVCLHPHTSVVALHSLLEWREPKCFGWKVGLQQRLCRKCPWGSVGQPSSGREESYQQLENKAIWYPARARGGHGERQVTDLGSEKHLQHT